MNFLQKFLIWVLSFPMCKIGLKEGERLFQSKIYVTKQSSLIWVFIEAEEQSCFGHAMICKSIHRNIWFSYSEATSPTNKISGKLGKQIRGFCIAKFLPKWNISVVVVVV